MNNIDDINILLYNSGFHRFIWTKQEDNIVLYWININSFNIICLDLDYKETSYINYNFEILIEKLEAFLFIYNNYSNKTYKNIWFWYVELDWTKYWNAIYLYNSKNNISWYIKTNSLWIETNWKWKILKMFRLLEWWSNDNLNTETIPEEKQAETNINIENYNIIHKMIENEELSTRNLMKYFRQIDAQEIFRNLKEQNIFEVDVNNKNNKIYYLGRFEELNTWIYEKYVNTRD